MLALFVLGFNFVKDVIASGWTTAGIILGGGRQLRPGFVRMPYGDLPDTAANFLGALVTLTPGTTTVDIDLERREYVLHLLDMERAETTLRSIRRDFVTPVRILFGGKA
jgi:multicomponent K+:H+ antiporter subunit E/multicomponent Na+:H+ antiporter subunit E